MKWKKVIAALLAFTLAFGVLPTTVFATNGQLPLDSDIDIYPGDDYTISGDSNTLNHFVTVDGGNLTISGTLMLGEEGYICVYSGTVTVTGTIDFGSVQNFADRIWVDGGDVLFKSGAKCSVRIPDQYVAKGSKLSTGKTDGKYFTVEEDPSTPVGKDYVDAQIKALDSKFSQYGLAISAFTTARTALNKLRMTGTLEQVTSIVNGAEAHLKYLEEINTYLNSKKDSVTELAEQYAIQYPSYAGVGSNSLTNKAKNALEGFSTAGGYYNSTITTYTDSQNCQKAVTDAQSAIDTAKTTAEDTVKAALFDNAKTAVTAELDKLTSLGENKTTYTNRIKQIKQTGPDGVQELEAVLADAKLKNARTKATTDLTTKYGNTGSPTINALLQKYLDAIDSAPSVAAIELAQGQAAAEIDPLLETYNEVKDSIQSIKGKVDELSDYTDYSDWIARLSAISVNVSQLTSPETGVTVDTTPITNATSTDELAEAETAVKNATILAVEKKLCTWELEYATKKDGVIEDSLKTIVDQYTANINDAANINAARRERDHGKDEINFTRAKAGAVNTVVEYVKTKFNDRVKENGPVFQEWDNFYSAVKDAYPDIVNGLDTRFTGATSAVQVESLVTTAQNDLWLAAEKTYALEQIKNAAAQDKNKSQAVTTLKAQYDVYIGQAITVSEVLQTAAAGVTAISDLVKAVDQRIQSVNTLEAHIKGLYANKKYAGYLKESLLPDDGLTNAAKNKLENQKALINSASTAEQVKIQESNATEVLEAQFITDLKTALITELGKDFDARKFYNENIATAPGEQCTLLTDPQRATLKAQVTAQITESGSGDVEDRADALVSGLNSALTRLSEVEAFKLTITVDSFNATAAAKDGYYKNGDSVLVEAVGQNESQAFDYWECTDGGFANVNTRRMTVVMTKNCTWHAVYKDGTYQTPVDETSFTAKMDGTYLTLSFDRKIYSGHIKAYGILYSTSVTSVADLKLVTYTQIQGNSKSIALDGDKKVSFVNKENGTEIGTLDVAIRWAKLDPSKNNLYAVAYYVQGNNGMVFCNELTLTKSGSGAWSQSNTSQANALGPQMQGPSIAEASLQPSQEPVQAPVPATEPASVPEADPEPEEQEEGQAQTQEIPEE